MELVIRVQILDKVGCVSLDDNALGKGMNPSLLPPAMSKQYDRLGSVALVREPV